MNTTGAAKDGEIQYVGDGRDYEYKQFVRMKGTLKMIMMSEMRRDRGYGLGCWLYEWMFETESMLDM